MQSFKVGGVILCEIMPYFQKIMRFFVYMRLHFILLLTNNIQCIGK